MKKEFLTDRLFLKEMELGDAATLFTFWSDEEVTKFMNISPFTEVSEAEAMIAAIQALSKKDQANRFSIFTRTTHELIGTCGFNQIDLENGRGEIGYDLGRPYWSRGFMAEALQALIDVGFRDYKLNRIEAKVEPGNTASQRLLVKLGFQKEGLLRQYEKKSTGQHVDLLLYSLLNSDRS